MQDPYKILGVPRDASDDEVKRAYRALSRKYHPDANVNNPHREQAEEMFKIVQQAYSQIMDERSCKIPGGGAGGGAYGDPFGGFGGYAEGGRGVDYSNPQMQAAANYINARHYREAMNVLENITDRTGTWYYLHAVAGMGLGDNIQALEDAETAMRMEPDNYEFQRLYRIITGQGGWYGGMSRGYGYVDPCTGQTVEPCCSPCCILPCCCCC
jgi:molecular chaperone DnaJ